MDISARGIHIARTAQTYLKRAGLWSLSGNGGAQKKEGRFESNSHALTKRMRKVLFLVTRGRESVRRRSDASYARAREQSNKNAKTLFNLREKSCRVLKMDHGLWIIWKRKEKKSDSVLLLGVGVHMKIYWVGSWLAYSLQFNPFVFVGRN